MNRNLLSLLFSFFLLGAFSAEAGNVLSAQISYRYVSGLQYSVLVRVFGDCSGSTLPDASLRIHQGRFCSGFLSPVNSSPFAAEQLGDSYRASAVTSCNSNQANFRYITYEYTITLSSPGLHYIEWSYDRARPLFSNLVPSISDDFYAYACINHIPNQSQNSYNFANQDFPVKVVPVNQPATFNFLGYEPDGDSLSYQLVATTPYCSLTFGYNPIPNATRVTWDSTVSPPIGYVFLSNMRSYSPKMPIHAFRRVPPSGGSQYSYFEPTFYFDTTTGATAYTPSRWVNTPLANGDNRYVWTVLIREWRRINGQKTLMGETTRDVVAMVENRSRVLPPVFTATPHPDLVQTPTGYVFYARAGQLTQLRFSARSPHANETIRLSNNTNQIPNANNTTAVIVGNNSTNPALEVTVNPSVQEIGSQFGITTRGQDQGLNNILRAESILTIKIVVVPSNFVGLAEVTKPRFTLAPNPSTGVFRLTGEIPTSLEVLSLTGQSLLQVRPESAGDEYTLRLDAQPAGVYILRAVDGRGRASVSRLVKE